MHERRSARSGRWTRTLGVVQQRVAYASAGEQRGGLEIAELSVHAEQGFERDVARVGHNASLGQMRTGLGLFFGPIMDENGGTAIA